LSPNNTSLYAKSVHHGSSSDPILNRDNSFYQHFIIYKHSEKSNSKSSSDQQQGRLIQVNG